MNQIPSESETPPPKLSATSPSKDTPSPPPLPKRDALRPASTQSGLSGPSGTTACAPPVDLTVAQRDVPVTEAAPGASSATGTATAGSGLTITLRGMGFPDNLVEEA